MQHKLSVLVSKTLEEMALLGGVTESDSSPTFTAPLFERIKQKVRSNGAYTCLVAGMRSSYRLFMRSFAGSLGAEELLQFPLLPAILPLHHWHTLLSGGTQVSGSEVQDGVVTLDEDKVHSMKWLMGWALSLSFQFLALVAFSYLAVVADLRWTSAEKYAALSPVTFEDMRSFAATLLRQMRAEVNVNGYGGWVDKGSPVR